MFIKINRINKSGEVKDTLIDLDKVIGVFENPTTTTDLYDCEGNVVESKPNPTTYNVECGTFRFQVDEKAYKVILKALAVK